MPRKYKSLADYFKQTKRSKQSLATEIGRTRQFVYLLSLGKRTPSLPLALQISQATGVPLEALVSTDSERVA